MDETRLFQFAKVPGPYKGADDDGNVIATGKRNVVADILKARAAALQATGVSAVVEEVDEQGRVIHTFPFYADGPSGEAEAARGRHCVPIEFRADADAETEQAEFDAEADAD